MAPVKDSDAKTFFGISTKTFFSWGVVIIIAGFASSYGSMITKVENVEKKVEIMEKMDEAYKISANQISERIAKLETQYTTIIDGIKEIKDNLKEVTNKK